MNTEANVEKGVSKQITTFMREKGIEVRAVEGEFLTLPQKGLVLCVNFLPSTDTFSNGIKAIEENVQIMLSFLVRNKYTHGINSIQIAVNTNGADCCHVLVKYWCEETKLRELERCRFPFFRTIMGKPLRDMVSGISFRGVPIDGFPEWCYKITDRNTNGIDVALYRIGESTMRFSLSLCETEPIPIVLLRGKVSKLEYEIQRRLNAQLYVLEENTDGKSDGKPIAFDVIPPNVHVLGFIRKFALAMSDSMTLGWLLPKQKIASFMEVIKNERIRVLEVQRFSSDEHSDSWHEDGFVWKTADMCSPTKCNIMADLRDVRSALEHECDSRGDDKSYQFLLDCRRPNIITKPKSGIGPGEPTYININDL